MELQKLKPLNNQVDEDGFWGYPRNNHVYEDGFFSYDMFAVKHACILKKIQDFAFWV